MPVVELVPQVPKGQQVLLGQLEEQGLLVLLDQRVRRVQKVQQVQLVEQDLLVQLVL